MTRTTLSLELKDDLPVTKAAAIAIGEAWCIENGERGPLVVQYTNVEGQRETVEVSAWIKR